MAIAFYMDENVSGKDIVDELREQGVDLITVQEDGLAGASDPDILDRATQLKRVVFTHDADFLREASRRWRENIPFYGVIYAHPRRVPAGVCVRDLRLMAEVLDPQDFDDRKIERLPL
jgi:predicted nuclease of predicted toxin-antitoxin system